MSEFRQLVKCPRCLAINAYKTPYLKCYNCSFIDKKDISYQVNEFEEMQRKKVKEIIKFMFDLFDSNIPIVEFPENSLNPEYEVVSWGWIKQEANAIFIPRKTFYLPNDELTDTVVHESSHLLSKEMGHLDYWHSFYIQQRKKIFAEFSDFVNLKNPQTKFEKGYKTYPSSNCKD